MGFKRRFGNLFAINRLKQRWSISKEKIVHPTEEEILRIKGVLILKRNATRDDLGFVALADRMGPEKIIESLRTFSKFDPQEGEKSALLQL